MSFAVELGAPLTVLAEETLLDLLVGELDVLDLETMERAALALLPEVRARLDLVAEVLALLGTVAALHARLVLEDAQRTRPVETEDGARSFDEAVELERLIGVPDLPIRILLVVGVLPSVVLRPVVFNPAFPVSLVAFCLGLLGFTVFILPCDRLLESLLLLVVFLADRDRDAMDGRPLFVDFF